MRQNYNPEKLKITNNLEGFSLKMVNEHFKLYEGYVKKTNEIQQKLEEADKSEANGVYSFIGELKRQETFAVNGMKLHEVYFGQLDGVANNATQASDEILKMIERDFGSMNKWKLDMIATGLSARGWGILAYDLKDGKLHNYGSDGHNVGAVWGAIPLIALDVYEHAYFIDYGVNRKDYINSFFKNLNWNYVNELIKKFNLT